jgi:hypothetical protein
MRGIWTSVTHEEADIGSERMQAKMRAEQNKKRGEKRGWRPLRHDIRSRSKLLNVEDAGRVEGIAVAIAELGKR